MVTILWFYLNHYETPWQLSRMQPKRKRLGGTRRPSAANTGYYALYKGFTSGRMEISWCLFTTFRFTDRGMITYSSRTMTD